MKLIADFHIHSKYSRATSANMTLEPLCLWAKKKGINILGTGDFTHPQWFKNLKEKLEPAELGLYKIKNNETRFVLTAEVSCIYSKRGKVRKIHILIFAPNFETVEKINTQLSWIGNLKADGRPILGLDAKELAKIVLNINEKCLIAPSHIWTPWFSIFGSKSGFDSIEECFEEYSKYIYAGETGLSSDPAMNWRLSTLDKITLISNSDAHSCQNLGREANVFEIDKDKLSYDEIIKIIKEKDKNKFLYTIEFYPEEGKYHFDGHRNCNISLSPKESKKYNNICPNCGKPLTIGVLNRVEELADRPDNFKPEGAIPFKSLVPLTEIIAEALSLGKQSKAVEEKYEDLIAKAGNEFKTLLELPFEQLLKITLPKIAEGIIKVRQDKVFKQPGYDGVFGKISVFSSETEKGETEIPQQTLFSN